MFFVQASTRQAMNMTLAFQHNFDAEIQDSRKRFRISKWHLKRTLGIEILTLKKEHLRTICTYFSIRTVGLHQQVQHSRHAEISIQNSQSHSKCTLVCNKLYSTYRLQHPLRKGRHP